MHPNHKDQLCGLNRIEGQVKGVKRMIADNRYCVDILTQLKAVKAAVHKVEQEILKKHMQNCLKHAVESKNDLEIQKKLDELMNLLSKRI